jgi:Ner family transcriptional regulator
MTHKSSMENTLRSRLQDWSPNAIKAGLRENGFTVAALSRQIGVTPQSVRLAMEVRFSAAVEIAIAKAVGLPAAEIWPSRYRHDGSRILLRPPVAKSQRCRDLVA